MDTGLEIQLKKLKYYKNRATSAISLLFQLGVLLGVVLFYVLLGVLFQLGVLYTHILFYYI